MTRVYGCSDDLVEIEGSNYPDGEIDCYDKDVRITFADGTVVRIGYPKDGMAVWWIREEQRGTADRTITVCEDEDADIYSDVFEIDSEIVSHEVLKPDDA